jgi:hypothetical protein
MAKRSFDIEDSAAYAALSPTGKRKLELVRAASASGAKSVRIEVEPGRFVNVKLAKKWRRCGAATSENINGARSIVDLAEAAFEAERATKR